jgi:plastocyanin
MRRTTLALATVATLALLGACGDDDTATPDDTAATDGTAAPDGTAEASGSTVTVDTFIFSPDPITVAAGTTISFENRDTTTHSATAGTREQPDAERFDVELAPEGAGELTLDEPGTYAYFCTFHSGEGMTGEITVV